MPDYLDGDIGGLIDRVYCAALDDSQWPLFLAALGGVVGPSRVMLHGHDLVANSNLGFVDVAYEPDFLSSFRHYYSGVNPWQSRAMVLPVGQVHVSEAVLPREQLVRTEFYNDWIRPQEDVGTGAGVTVFRDDTSMFRLSVNLRLQDQERLQPGLVHLLELLVPHLRHAFEIMRLRTGAVAGIGEALVLEAIRHPAIAVDRSGRYCYANRAGSALLEAGDTIRVGRGGYLMRPGGGAITEIADYLARFAARRPDFSLRLSLRDARQRPVLGTLLPIAGRAPATFPSANLSGVPAAIVVVQQLAAEQPRLSRADLAALHLTDAEARLALALFEGRSLKAVAAENAISIHTVRNQLKAVFEKTGVRRQGELVAFLSRLIGDGEL